MTPVAQNYGQALYCLALEEGLSLEISQELAALQEGFRAEPEYLRLLSSPALTKAERCQVLDDSFRNRVQPYVLNFLKLLTEKGYIRHFDGCCKVYAELYDLDNGILPVTAVTALPLEDSQRKRLQEALAAKTGKTIRLNCRVDKACLGGIRLEYDGKLVDDTLLHRLDSIGAVLKNTVI